MTPAPLTTKEHDRYEICKETITKNLPAAFEIGMALIEIRDKEYYREEFKTFAEFCKQTYQLEKSRAYQFIDAAEVKLALPASVQDCVTNEAQARVLSKVPEGDRYRVIKEAQKAGPLTATNLLDASKKSTIVDTKESSGHDKTSKDLPKTDENSEESNKGDKSAPKSKKVIEVDEVGTPIPSDALPFWKRKQEAQDLLTQITNIKSTVSKSMQDGDALFAKVSNSVIDDLSRAYTHLLEAKPYAVCTVCMGSFSVQPKGCSMCGNKGLISKWQWDTQSRMEVKQIRLRANVRADAA